MKCFRRTMTISLPISSKYKKILQTMALVSFFIYISLVFYHTVYSLPAGEGIDNSGSSSGGSKSGSNSEQQNSSSSLDDTQTLVDYLELNLPKDLLLNSAIPDGGAAVVSDNSKKLLESARDRFRPTRSDLRDISEDDYYYSSVTGTPKPPNLQLNDIFISVKTTKSYHDNRLALIIKTWFQLAKDQTWFFTDTNDQQYQKLTNNHMINTNCSQGHIRKALCCKMGKEFDYFLSSGKKWWCHFDDDNYVNVPRLVSLLSEYNPAQEWYLGKPSISSPLEIFLDNNKFSLTPSETNKKITFWFATGGAGFCVSQALGRKMKPVAGSGNFVQIGDKIRFPDDVTMGFIIESILKRPLTVVDAFHSHFEPMEFIRPETFQDQISFSYAKMKNEWNVVKIDGGFDAKTDPKRFFSLHCHLFPNFNFCPKHTKTHGSSGSSSSSSNINSNKKLNKAKLQISR